MAAKASLQQIPAVVVIQAGARGYLVRRGAAANAVDLEQHEEPNSAQSRKQQSPTSQGQQARIEVLSPALRTSPGVRRSISLEPAESEDDHKANKGQGL